MKSLPLFGSREDGPSWLFQLGRHVVALIPILALALGLAAWLWPIGFGGKMPVGGDVTQFSIGLMAVLSRAIRAGRIPLWNDLWGYGFPGVAESQMGVFYPPHLILYGLLPVEAAYTASLVLHTFWGAFGTYWAARRLGISREGGALAGLTWSACGFFLIHLPHQWGYTTGSWMPWAWGLAWILARGEGTGRDVVRLAAVLALQILPGHFQLAFNTQVGVLLIGLAALGERLARRLDSARGVGRLGLALLAVGPLAAMQLYPTYRLARLAGGRDYEYLSGFAATPLHLVSFVAPGLFHHSPLWRPLAWDPFHTSPEEYLAYIGLVPLFLALGAIGSGLRREPATRTLTLLALATLVLSLGPYVPGFSYLCRLPGFSFFRAPARWSLATQLALALQAGQGFDRLRTWPRPGVMLAWFSVTAALMPAVVVLGVELALASTGRQAWPPAEGFTRALHWLPWEGDPEFRVVMRAAWLPQEDVRVRTALARQGWTERVFVRARRSIYEDELGRSYALLLTLLILSAFARRPRFFATALLVLTGLDLLVLSRHRALDFGPARSLVDQSPVLTRLAALPRGTRSIDSMRNLPMVAGAAPVSAYRTLDLPVVNSLTTLAQASFYSERTSGIAEALRAAGAEVRVLDPFDTTRAYGRMELPVRSDAFVDRSLGGWLNGADLVARDINMARFTVWKPPQATSRAWLVPLTSTRAKTILEAWSGDPAEIIALLDCARPLPVRSERPERLEIEIEADAGPAVVVVSQLADPAWRARWKDGRGSRSAVITPVFRHPIQGATGWQSVAVGEPGRRTLTLVYPGYDVYEGLAVSGLAWLAAALIFFRLGRGEPR
jgi:hypothetical protein